MNSGQGRACIGLAAALVLAASGAAAQETPRGRSAAVARLADRPYTQAELGVGVLTLPRARFCLSNPQTCTRGDLNPAGFVAMLYRPNRLFAVGAGAMMGVPSGSNEPASSQDVDRSHTRSYLMFDATARYYALQLDWIEGWVGGTLGGVVIKDQYTNKTENPSAPILGPGGISIRTEGVGAGIEAGVAWSFALNFSVAAMLRTAWWFLPEEKAAGPTGDSATLSGQTPMFSLGVALAYRIGL
jgi:hypothetical protein